MSFFNVMKRKLSLKEIAPVQRHVKKFVIDAEFDPLSVYPHNITSWRNFVFITDLTLHFPQISPYRFVRI